jgi:hypothetical protein
MGPTVFGLLMREPIGFGDRGSLGQAVRRDLLGLGPRGRSHTLMDRLAVDAGAIKRCTTWMLFGPSSRAMA